MIILIIISLTFSSVTHIAESIAVERFRVEEALVNLRYYSGPKIVFYMNLPSYRFKRDLVYYPAYRYPLEIINKRFFSDAGVTVENIFPEANLKISLNYSGESSEFNIYLPERKRSFNLIFNLEKSIFNDPFTIRMKKLDLQRKIQLHEAVRRKEEYVKSVQKMYQKLLYLKEIRDVYRVLYKNIFPYSSVIDSIISTGSSSEDILILSSLLLDVESRLFEVEKEFEKTGYMLKSMLGLDTLVIEDSLVPLEFNGPVSSVDWKIDSMKIELSKIEDLENFSRPNIDITLGAAISGMGRNSPEAFRKISLRNLVVGFHFVLPFPLSLKYPDFVESKYRYMLFNKKMDYEYRKNYRSLISGNPEYMEKAFEMKKRYGKILESALTLLGKLSPITFEKFYSRILKGYERSLKEIYSYNLTVIEVEEN